MMATLPGTVPTTTPTNASAGSTTLVPITDPDSVTVTQPDVIILKTVRPPSAQAQAVERIRKKYTGSVRPPEDWTITDVCTWLNRLPDNASLYTTHFRSAYIDGRTLFTLDDMTLRQRCRMNNAVARMRVMYEIGKLRRERMEEMEMLLKPEEEAEPDTNPMYLIYAGTRDELSHAWLSQHGLSVAYPESLRLSLETKYMEQQPIPGTFVLDTCDHDTVNHTSITFSPNNVITRTVVKTETNHTTEKTTFPWTQTRSTSQIELQPLRGSISQTSSSSMMGDTPTSSTTPMLTSIVPTSSPSHTSQDNSLHPPPPLLRTPSAASRFQLLRTYVRGQAQTRSMQRLAEQARMDMLVKNMRRDGRLHGNADLLQSFHIKPLKITVSESTQHLSNASTFISQPSSSTLIENTPKKPRYPRFHRFVVSPENTWRIRWEIIILLLVLYYAVSIPLTIGFSAETEGWKVWMIPLELAFTGLLLFDLILNFFTVFRHVSGPDRGVIEYQLRAIAHHYMRGWFWVDLISALPIDAILYYAATNDSNSAHIARILMLLKIPRIFKVQRAFNRLVEEQLVNPFVLRLFQLVGVWLILWHWMACMYWLILTYENFNANPDLQWAGFIDPSIDFPSLYLACVSWSVTATTGVGRNIVPMFAIEAIYTIVCILTGMILMAFIIGSIRSTMEHLDHATVERRNKIEVINSYLGQHQVPQDLVKRIIEFYEYLWSRYKGISKHTRTLKDLHSGLKFELDLVINQKLIYKVPMFRELSENCVLDIGHKLTSEIYLPDELVVVQGEVVNCMYFILRGKLELIDGNGQKICEISDGDSFGKRNLCLRQRRETTVRSITHSELLVLTRVDFRRIMFKHPSFGMTLHKCVYIPDVNNYSGWERVAFAIDRMRLCNMLNHHDPTKCKTFAQIVSDIGHLAKRQHRRGATQQASAIAIHKVADEEDQD